MKMLAVLVSIFISSHLMAEIINAENDPNNFSKSIGTRMITAFDELPAEGRLSDTRLGWSETYWPSNKGGIAFRWNHPNPQPFKYKLYSKDELKSMPQSQLEQLSPSELYDIAMNDYNYSLTKKI